MFIDRTSENPSCQFPSRDSSVLLPNVPLLDLSCFRRTNSWSFIKDHQSSDYFTSNAYLIDAINISLRIPITYQPRIPCSNDRHEDNKQPINFRRMKQIIFSHQIKPNQKYPCKSPQTPSVHKSKEKYPSISSHSFKSESKITIRPQINPPVSITSRTRFGRGLLALYFQKYRYLSPVDQKKKEQFLRLLKASNILKDSIFHIT